MAAPNMATITASLERSLQNCSLNHTHNNHHQPQQTSTSRSSAAESPGNLPSNYTDASLDLNSQIALPYHWEQCLDLKTGEIYYINWRTGMKATEDPRTTVDYSGDFYSDDDDTSYDSDGSSSEEESQSCSSSARHMQEDDDEPEKLKRQKQQKEAEVLVVAGCKSCLMYFMVAKQVGDCPKCCDQLLHFDRSENGSAPGSP